jgi:hypothetical protein
VDNGWIFRAGAHANAADRWGGLSRRHKGTEGGVWRNFEKNSRVVAGWHPLWSKAAPASATWMRRGLEILKLLRVPRGSVRGKMRRGLRASCYPGERSRYRAGTPSGSGCRVDARLQGIILESNSAGKQCGGVLERRINEFANLALGNRKRPGGNPARGLGFFEVLEKPILCGTRKGGFHAASGSNGVGP